MQINKHGTFYIRNGWPTKIMRTVASYPYIFSPASERDAVDEMGVGRVMVKAMRYWAYATGITEETKESQGISQKLTELGQYIADYDQYCQKPGTLWLMHRALATNLEITTAWAWAFNFFGRKTFTKDDFVDAFFSFTKANGETYRRAAVEKEFDCFKNTYVSDKSFDINKIIDEDTIPFFAPIKLITYLGKGVYEMRNVGSKEIPLDVFLYSILMDNSEHLEERSQISIDELLDGYYQVGKYFNLTYSSLIEMLQFLENEKKLILINNFGNRYIELGSTKTSDLLDNYYREIEG